jgi:hypothetical protein
MGCYSVYCQASKISITGGEEVVLFILNQDENSSYRVYQVADKYTPVVLPIFGKYNSYGCIENIKENANTKLIEENYKMSIQKFCNYITRIYWDEVPKELQNFRPCWMLKEIYDFLISRPMTWNAENFFKTCKKDNRLTGHMHTILGIDDYAYLEQELYTDHFDKLNKELDIWKNKLPITRATFQKLEVEKDKFFIDGLYNLWILILNLNASSCIFEPIIEPLSPQDGGFKAYLKLSRKITQILKERVKEEEE